MRRGNPLIYSAAGKHSGVAGGGVGAAVGRKPDTRACVGWVDGADARLIVLEIFDEGDAFGFTHVGAEGVAAIAGSVSRDSIGLETSNEPAHSPLQNTR